MGSVPADQDTASLPPLTRVPGSRVLSIWTITDHPTDRPDVVVARRHEICDGGHQPTDDVLEGATLDEVRAQLPPGLINIGRQDADDPVILESWV